MAFIRHMRRSAFFRRQAGRPDKGNCLESGDAISDKKQKTLAISVIFGDILRLIYSRFVQFMGVSCNGI